MIFDQKRVSTRDAARSAAPKAGVPESGPALPNSALAACIGESATDPGLEKAMLARLSSLLGTDETTPSPLKIHYNSLKPQQFSAKAYTRGADIYLAPGEEDSLGHELGHVRQQALGGVRPTRMAAGQPVNDDPLLEARADDAGCLSGWLPAAFSGSVIQCDGPGRQQAPRVRYSRMHRPRGMSPFGDNQSLTFHRPVDPVAGEHNIQEGVLQDIYTPGNQEKGIRFPHSFRDTPHRQVARWFASALSDNSGISGEIQCYFDEASHELLVATNKRSEYADLASVDTLTDTPMQEYSKPHIARRRERHMRKLAEVDRRLRAGEMVYGPESGLTPEQIQELQNAYQDIYFNYTVHFLPPGATADLHAEQRILEYLRSTTGNNDLLLDPARLGGLRRPCLACASRVFSPADAARYAGPYWDTDSAITHWDARDSVLDDVRIGTHVTASEVDADADGQPVYNLHYDADSESDSDFSEESDPDFEPEPDDDEEASDEEELTNYGLATRRWRR